MFPVVIFCAKTKYFLVTIDELSLQSFVYFLCVFSYFFNEYIVPQFYMLSYRMNENIILISKKLMLLNECELKGWYNYAFGLHAIWWRFISNLFSSLGTREESHGVITSSIKYTSILPLEIIKRSIITLLST